MSEQVSATYHTVLRSEACKASKLLNVSMLDASAFMQDLVSEIIQTMPDAENGLTEKHVRAALENVSRKISNLTNYVSAELSAPHTPGEYCQIYNMLAEMVYARFERIRSDNWERENL